MSSFVLPLPRCMELSQVDGDKGPFSLSLSFSFLPFSAQLSFHFLPLCCKGVGGREAVRRPEKLSLSLSFFSSSPFALLLLPTTRYWLVRSVVRGGGGAGADGEASNIPPPPQAPDSNM